MQVEKEKGALRKYWMDAKCFLFFTIVATAAVAHCRDLDCSSALCFPPECNEGDIVVPNGECCPVCVPHTDRCAAVDCLVQPVCKKGQKLKAVKGVCCPVCVSECKIAGQVFSYCASHCPETCEQPDPLCAKVCSQGCTCPPGQVLDRVSMRCTTLEKCPGSFHGKILFSYLIIFFGLQKALAMNWTANQMPHARYSSPLKRLSVNLPAFSMEAAFLMRPVPWWWCHALGHLAPL